VNVVLCLLFHKLQSSILSSLNSFNPPIFSFLFFHILIFLFIDSEWVFPLPSDIWFFLSIVIENFLVKLLITNLSWHGSTIKWEINRPIDILIRYNSRIRALWWRHQDGSAQQRQHEHNRRAAVLQEKDKLPLLYKKIIIRHNTFTKVPLLYKKKTNLKLNWKLCERKIWIFI